MRRLRNHRNVALDNQRGNTWGDDFTLSEEDLAELDGLDRTGRTDRALDRNWG